MHALPASLLVAVAGLAMLWHSTDGAQALTAESARRLQAVQSPLPISAFPLETMTGIRIKVPDSRKLSLVEFIYTSCPTLCNAAGADMRQLADRLTAAGLTDRATLVSVSFDPTFDNVERLAGYGERHKADGKRWTIARPNPQQLESIMDEFGVIAIPDHMGGYVHNVAVHVVTADGRLVGIYDTRDFEGIVQAVREHAL